MTRVRFYLHVALWCALFGAFAWISGPIVGPAVMENRIGPIEVNRSIDAYLGALTGLEHGSEKLPDTFQRLGRTGLLIVFVRGDYAQSEFLGMMVGYVSWPREVRLIKVTTPTVERELADINPNSVAGLVFCSVNPPAWLEKRIRLGPSIVLVPLPEKEP